MIMPDIHGIITQDADLTFEEAVRYFGEKIPVTPAQFMQLADKYKSLAFTVSGYTKVQILSRFYEELLEAIAAGSSFNEFRESANEFLAANGYSVLTPFQADNIFRTNIQAAYNAGHYERMTEAMTLRLRPYWQYNAVPDNATRPAHLAMNGKVYMADNPVWDTWYPPNGYRCRCTVTSLSERQVMERGLKVEQEAPERVQMPDGSSVNITPDQGFSYNPAKTRFEPDLTGYPESLVKAYKRAQSHRAAPEAL